VIVEAESEKDGKTTAKICLYLNSLEATAKEFNGLVRNHWSIENHLHWKLDVVFREDRIRTKTGNAAGDMATARQLALQLTRARISKASRTEGKWPVWMIITCSISYNI